MAARHPDGLAWAAHVPGGKEPPGELTYPPWSLTADFKMWWLWLTRRLEPELKKALSRQ